MFKFNTIRFDIIYVIIVTLLFINVLFEFCFKYLFYTKIGGVYFVFSSIFIYLYFISQKKTTDFLNIKLTYILYVIIIIICARKLFLIPFIAIPYINVTNSNIDKGKKILFILGNCVLLVLLYLMFLFYTNTRSVIDIKFSNDRKYIAVVESIDLGATGGETDVYVGRNINLGVLGYYCPRKLKYYGHSDERPEIEFLEEGKIMIKNRTIEIKGNKYIDDYY